MNTRTYTASVESGRAFGSDSMEIRATRRAVVHHVDGTRAWVGPSHWADAKRVAGHTVDGDCLALATRNARALEAFLTRTGTRWEVVQAAKVEAKRIASRRVHRIAEIERTLKRVPALRKELRELQAAAAPSKRRGAKTARGASALENSPAK